MKPRAKLAMRIMPLCLIGSALASCGSSSIKPIPVVPEKAICPAPPPPPDFLMRAPVLPDFLSPKPTP